MDTKKIAVAAIKKEIATLEGRIKSLREAAALLGDGSVNPAAKAKTGWPKGKPRGSKKTETPQSGAKETPAAASLMEN